MKSFVTKIGNPGEIVSALGWLAFLFAAYGAAMLAWELRGSRSFTVSPVEVSKESLEISGQGKVPFEESLRLIKSRNLFGVKDADVNKAVTKKAQKELTLRLVATNSLSGSSPFAIIEDTSKKKQKVFDLMDSVFEQGKLVEVLMHSVKIDVDGRIEELHLQADKTKAKGQAADSASMKQDFSIPEQELTNALADLPRLLSEARAVPYFRNGVSVGMRMFAIRKGSMYEKLGLKNGDILKAVNDNSLSDPAQALKLFEKLKDERSIHLMVERAGEDVEFRYSID